MSPIAVRNDIVTPPLTTSFSNRRSGLLSGRSQAAPADDILRSVVAKMMASPTHSIGTKGIPAIIILFTTFNNPVSIYIGGMAWHTRESSYHEPVKSG